MSNPIHESQLPAVLTIELLASVLGMSTRTIHKRRKGKSWPFTEIVRLDRKPRWSRDAVLAIVNGQALPRRTR